MNRRDVITLLAGTAAWPFAARAQTKSAATIGFLGANTAAVQRHYTAALVARMRELGWIEGRNLTIEYRWAEGRYDRSPALVRELVERKVDLIVTHAPPNVVAAKRVTSDVPIVFAAVGDPVSSPRWPARAAISPAFRCSRRTSPASGSNCCGRFCRRCAGWASWAMRPAPTTSWSGARSRLLPGPWDSIRSSPR
jgi:ABC transporter substrate binding protein